ncbi:MAG: BPSS1780 family membrane protein [Thiohalorhabdus sp.]|uniref:BPSS1780 family membrane protein n=1 Tax=Thiohalorhabdus sp. TaxID=3094134 RepID=UPI003980B98B
MANSRVAAARGAGWYADGWSAFRAAPGPWVLAAAGYMLITLVLNFVPLIGPIVGAVIGPGLLAGLLLMARAVEDGGEVRAGMLFQALGDGQSRGPLLVLGAVALAGTLLAGLILVYTAPGEVAPGGGMEPGEPMPGGPPPTGALIATFLVMLAVSFALFFAIPLVTFRDLDPLAAMRESFAACLRNLGAVLVFLVLYLILGFVAFLPMGLGFLLLLPVGMGAAYQAYREVFPEPPEEPAE